MNTKMAAKPQLHQLPNLSPAASSPLLIAIAAKHANTDHPTGVEHYCKQLILALARIDRYNKYLIYLPGQPVAALRTLPPNFTIKIVATPFAWTQWGVSRQMLKDKPDALLVPSFAMPLIHPRNSVVTIHDLAWYLFPETHRRKQRLWLQFTHWFACRSAKHLIAVSGQTKSDLSDHFAVPDQKVTVIHHGFSLESETASVGAQTARQERHEEQKRIASIAEPFVLYLGTLQPRKNLNRLIDAFTLAKARTGIPHKLVIAGRKGWWCDETLKKIEATQDVIYFGYVLDRLALLRKAAALVLPSTYEGFGLTLLDAFAENIPALCSNCSSMPEVAGGAAELFDPHDTESIAEALARVLTDRERSSALIRKGRQRLKQFSWDDCARSTLQILESPLNR